MAGFIFDAQKGYYEAAFWKNGTETVLSNSPMSSVANAIAINGMDVYVAGFIYGTATLWKNGVATTLAGGSSTTSTASAIALSGSDIYIAGYSSRNGVYWKDNTLTLLGGLAGISGATGRSIAVNGSDIYVAGGADNSGYVCYWVDGTAVQLTKEVGAVYGIAVVPK